MSRGERFLAACLGRPVDTTPIWVMRQAGRYLPEYRQLRERYSFLTMCKTPELVAEVTAQPVARFELDAAILFSDLLLPAEAMGLTISFGGGGPRVEPPVRTAADLEGLRPGAAADWEYLAEAVALAARAVPVPLIGFCGGPFTLASYLVEGSGSREHVWVKRLLVGAPDLAHRLFEMLTATLAAFLTVQIEAGVQTVQVFDSWVGTLGREELEAFAFPYARRLIASLPRRTAGGAPLPVIYFGRGLAGHLAGVSGLGADVVGVDWGIPLAEAVAALGSGVAVQGNLDPALLLAPPERIHAHAASIVAAGRTARGHVFNLGHGILPDTPPDHLGSLVDLVHELGARP